MMPLLSAMPYEKAVEISRTAKRLGDRDRDRIIDYLAGWAPEVLATAIEDLGLIERPAISYSYDTNGMPVVEFA